MKEFERICPAITGFDDKYKQLIRKLTAEQGLDEVSCLSTEGSSTCGHVGCTSYVLVESCTQGWLLMPLKES